MPLRRPFCTISTWANRISSRTRVVNCSDARLTSSPTDASLAGESCVATPDTSSAILPAPRSSVAAALPGDQCRPDRVEIHQTATDVCSRRCEGANDPLLHVCSDHQAATRCWSNASAPVWCTPRRRHQAPLYIAVIPFLSVEITACSPRPGLRHETTRLRHSVVRAIASNTTSRISPCQA
jgi:hypothetical protein